MLSATTALAVALIRRFEGPGPLHVAAALNDCAEVKRLLDRGRSVDEPMQGSEIRRSEEEGSTPLMWAASRNSLDAARILLEAGADPKAVSGWDDTPLALASEHGHAAMVKLLLPHRSAASVDTATALQDDSLSRAARSGNPETLQALLDAGAALDRAEGVGWPTTALGSAAAAGRLDNMRFLIKAGASVNPAEGTPPLMLAIQAGKDEAARLLLESGATIDDSEPVLWEAAEHNMTETARLLIARGAGLNVSHPVANGWTPLRRAVIRSNLELARMLVDAGADPMITDDDGETILFSIDWKKASPDMIDFLFGLGIDINRRSNAGHTVLMQQIHCRDVEAVRRLLAASADVNIRDDQGMAAIDYAEKPLGYSSHQVLFAGQPANMEIVQSVRERMGAR